jgi:hypothetical protein
MKAIHLIQKDPDLRPWPSAEGPPQYESGYWDLAKDRAESLVGGDIYFYEKRSKPSFFGGVIESFRIMDKDPWKGRIIFILRSLRGHKEQRTSKAGWSMEMKIED